MARGGGGQPARFAEELPASTGTFKFKDFMKLINSVSSKKGLFLFGILLSLVTSGASLVVPQLTKGLVDTSELSKIDGKMVAVLLVAFAVYLGFGTIGGFLLRYVGEHSVKSLRENYGHICFIYLWVIMMNINQVKAVLV